MRLRFCTHVNNNLDSIYSLSKFILYINNDVIMTKTTTIATMIIIMIMLALYNYESLTKGQH